ncbi:MAG: hypothetical protein HZB16_19650 [Armatimonadetes bacterium]|nr:hypothetical protein [Armatimonadota bacterium]
MTLRTTRRAPDPQRRLGLGGRAVALLSSLLLSGALWAADEPVPAPADPAPTTAPAAATTPAATIEIPKVTVKFDKTEIADVAMQLHEQTGFDFVVGRGVQGQVTASFTDQPLDKLLNTLGIVLGLTVERHDKMFVIKTKQAPEAMAGPLTGAGALLPGEAPVTPLKEAGADLGQLGTTTAPAAGTTPASRRVAEQIPLNAMKPQVAAGLFGAPWIDANGNAHTPQEAMYNQWLAQQWQNQQNQQNNSRLWADPGWSNQAWPNGNLPEGSVVGQNGTILLPNGTIIGRNGQVTFPNGTVRLPNGQTVLPNGTVIPFGANTNQRPLAQGNVGGVPFSVGPNGNLNVAPGGLNLGGLGTLYLPGMNIGGNGNQNVLPQVGPTSISPNGKIDGWINGLGPSVHYGKPPVSMNSGLVAPGWKFAPPRGMENVKPGVVGAVGTPVTGVAEGFKHPRPADEPAQP